METHKKIALGIYCLIAFYVTSRDGFDEGSKQLILLAICLIPIIFYRIIAFFSGFGFPELFAKDYGSTNHPEPYAFFFWILFLIACGFVIFEWSIY